MKRPNQGGSQGQPSGLDDMLFAQPQAAQAADDDPWSPPQSQPGNELSSVLRGVRDFDLQPDSKAPSHAATSSRLSAVEPAPASAATPAFGMGRTPPVSFAPPPAKPRAPVQPAPALAPPARAPAAPAGPVAAAAQAPQAGTAAAAPRTTRSQARLLEWRRRRRLLFSVTGGWAAGIGLGAYVWLGVGSIPLAAVVAGLSTVGCTLAWVLLRR